MLEQDKMERTAGREESERMDEPQGWCSPEFPSGCILDSDLEDRRAQ